MINKMTASMSLLLAAIVITTKCHRISSQALHDSNLQGAEPEPEFEGAISNVTYPAGRDAILTCSVKSLGKYKVGWLRASDQTVLALQGRVVTHNSRISVIPEDNHTWRLRIKQIRESDKGCYMCQINSSPMKKQIGCIDVQVSPDIINDDSSTDTAVKEGEDAVLKCPASGSPTPRVTWRREDGDPILLRKLGHREMVKVDTFNGTYLRLGKVERRQMGVYLCIASNDVPPAVSKRILLSVNFPPQVRTPSQLLGAPLGSDVHLHCQVESSPHSVAYWVKGGRTAPPGGITSGSSIDMGQQRVEMLLDGPKYGMVEIRNGYKLDMKLTVKSFSSADVGTYHCLSSNSIGKSEGTLRLYEIKIHQGSGTDADSVNFVGGLAEATRDRGNSSANSPQLIATKTIVLLLTSLGIFLTTSHAR